MFLRIFRHLLPNARAWRLVSDKMLRHFFTGLAGVGEDAKRYFDLIWLDIFPADTRELDAFEWQFALPQSNLSLPERRSRLDAAWKAIGGQDPRYIQDTLRARGFDVYVHEWWEPGTEPAIGSKACATPRNPIQNMRREYTQTLLLVECGEELAACGEEFAEAGNSLNPRGYPLVNKVLQTVPDYVVLCGEDVAACGEQIAECGNYVAYREIVRPYIVPNDVTKWPYFLYIGDETFGDIAQVDPSRRDEFEDICLKICPSQQWLGILVEYV